MAKKTISEIREEPGMSNAGKYKDVSKDDFCGPKGTYPVNSLERAKSALKLAHNAKDPEAIKSCVYTKFPELKKGSKMSRRGKDGASMGDGDEPSKREQRKSDRKLNRNIKKSIKKFKKEGRKNQKNLVKLGKSGLSKMEERTKRIGIRQGERTRRVEARNK